MDKHQQLMDEAYDKWNKEWKGIRYNEFVDRLSPVHAMAVVLGDMNDQVCNGGWVQWVDNGYCTKINELISALKRIGTPNALKVLEMVMTVRGYLRDEVIAGTYEIRGWGGDYYNEDYEAEETCYECRGDGYVNFTNDDGEDDTCDCEVCGGSGVIESEDTHPTFDEEDTAFSEINEALMVECNEYFMKI